MPQCLLFESKSIQSFVLATNRIKEIVGASELIESLTDELLTKALIAADATDDIRFTRRAGGAFFAFSDNVEALDRLAALWSMTVPQYAPGMRFMIGKGAGETDMEAFERARAMLAAQEPTAHIFEPEAGPLIVRSKRSGMPASYREGPEAISASTFRKLRFSNADKLTKRFAPESRARDWPLALTPEEHGRNNRDFPYIGEKRLLGVVHADGNGLGQVLLNLQSVVQTKPELFFDIFSDFSKLIDDVTNQAARVATDEVLAPARVRDVYPARPVVLAGEDLTIIVRADLAIPYCQSFIAEFEKQSARALKRIRKKYKVNGLPAQLTACAGVAFVQSTQPYSAAYQLAAALCDSAKDRSTQACAQDRDAIPSSIAFHRVTTAIIDDVESILERELTAQPPRQQTQTNGASAALRSSLLCYGLGDSAGLPSLSDLKALTAFARAKQMARGPTRELLSLLEAPAADARRRYLRWREVMQTRQPDDLQRFDTLMAPFVGEPSVFDLPFGEADNANVRHSPLGDVEILTQMEAF